MYGLSAADEDIQARARAFADELIPYEVEAELAGGLPGDVTAAHKKHALFAKPDVVAKDIVDAMDDRAAEVYVPKVWRLIMPLVRSTPEALFQKLPFLSGR